MSEKLAPMRWDGKDLYLLDQRILPHREEWVRVGNAQDCHKAIYDMVVRGAPCIGFSGLWGVVLWLKENKGKGGAALSEAASFLKTARPTAVNLAYEIDELLSYLQAQSQTDNYFEVAEEYTQKRIALAEEQNLAMAKWGIKAIEEDLGKGADLRLMTHCNTGFLACGTIGTALGVISLAAEQSRVKSVWVDETRPYMQGIRLTAYELAKQDIAHKVVVEGAASHLMKNGLVDAILVGADRIVANGDTANKVGTSTLAIVAKHYGVPFYVVAPSSSFDLKTEQGSGIEIELRNEEEILSFKGDRVAPRESSAFNPSFDVTDSSLITGIICEKGIIRPDYVKNIKGLLS